MVGTCLCKSQSINANAGRLDVSMVEIFPGVFGAKGVDRELMLGSIHFVE